MPFEMLLESALASQDEKVLHNLTKLLRKCPNDTIHRRLRLVLHERLRTLSDKHKSLGAANI